MAWTTPEQLDLLRSFTAEYHKAREAKTIQDFYPLVYKKWNDVGFPMENSVSEKAQGFPDTMKVSNIIKI